MAHENTVLLMTTMGAAVTEQAIINDAHARGIQSNRQNRDGQPNYGRCLCGISRKVYMIDRCYRYKQSYIPVIPLNMGLKL